MSCKAEASIWSEGLGVWFGCGIAVRNVRGALGVYRPKENKRRSTRDWTIEGK